MTLMFVVAVHAAFPILIPILVTTLILGAVVFVVAFVPLYVLIAFTSESKNGALNVADNPNLKRLWWCYLIAVIGIYISMCALIPLAGMMVA